MPPKGESNITDFVIEFNQNVRPTSTLDNRLPYRSGYFIETMERIELVKSNREGVDNRLLLAEWFCLALIKVVNVYDSFALGPPFFFFFFPPGGFFFLEKKGGPIAWSASMPITKAARSAIRRGIGHIAPMCHGGTNCRGTQCG